MITEIETNGFRSLKNFQMEIRPGLNVLVGPNGSGKTNIILFFEFLRLCSNNHVREAVSKMGGAGQVFRKRGKVRYSDSMEVELKGITHNKDTSYKYSIRQVVRASLSEQEIYYERQELRIRRVDAEADYISINWSWDGNKSTLDLIEFPEKDGAGIWSREEVQRHMRADMFTQYMVPWYLGHFNEVASGVAKDLSSRFMLNVVPSVVKSPEDSTREPGIDTDGSGLSATLYAIKKNRAIPDFASPAVLLQQSSPKRPSWARVVSLIKVAVPNIEDIDIQNEPFDNKLRTTITVGKGNQKAVLPLAAMSDGTVKWMSLVTRLATSSSALLLEEPENYLHPLMQTEIVRLLREASSDGSFALISTHSETLLNALRVDELVVVSYSGGGTKAKRVTNALQLTAEIRATGFGLGYYYLADAIRS